MIVLTARFRRDIASRNWQPSGGSSGQLGASIIENLSNDDFTNINPAITTAFDSLILFAGDWQVVEFDLSLRIISDGWIVEIAVVVGLLLVFHHILLVLKSCHSFEALRYASSVKAEIGGENYHREKIIVVVIIC
jgi:hypothetical protein